MRNSTIISPYPSATIAPMTMNRPILNRTMACCAYDPAKRANPTGRAKMAAAASVDVRSGGVIATWARYRMPIIRIASPARRSWLIQPVAS